MGYLHWHWFQIAFLIQFLKIVLKTNKHATHFLSIVRGITKGRSSGALICWDGKHQLWLTATRKDGQRAQEGQMPSTATATPIILNQEETSSSESSEPLARAPAVIRMQHDQRTSRQPLTWASRLPQIIGITPFWFRRIASDLHHKNEECSWVILTILRKFSKTLNLWMSYVPPGATYSHIIFSNMLCTSYNN